MKSNSSLLAKRKRHTAIKDLDCNIIEPTQTIEAISVENRYSGPIPSPKHLQEYESILPGISDRIMSMAEKNSEHIREKEITHIHKHYSDKNSAKAAGFILILAVLLLTYHAINANMPTLAALLGGSTVLSIGTIFVLGKRAYNKQKNDLNKEE